MKDQKARQPQRPAPRGPLLSGGGSEIAAGISAAAAGGAAPAAPVDPGELLPVSFARLFPAGGDDVAEIEHAIAERPYGPAVRAAAHAVAGVLDALPVDAQGAEARAALLGLDGRELLRLGRLARKPDAAVTGQEALLAL